MIRKVISERTFKDWHKGVFFTGGKGYAVTPSGSTICVGDESELRKEELQILPQTLTATGKGIKPKA